MACFSLELIKDLIIWAIIFGAVWAIIQLLLPLVTQYLTGSLGTAVNILIQAIKIVFAAVVLIVIVIFVFDLISCLIGLAPSLLPHR